MAVAFGAALKQLCFRAKTARHLDDRVEYNHDQNGNLETTASRTKPYAYYPRTSMFIANIIRGRNASDKRDKP
jgi:hypothetical protein